MRSTPRTIAEDRHCAHSYAAEQHALTGHMTLHFLMKEKGGRVLINEPRAFEAERTWLTYAAQPQRCPSISSPPPNPEPGDQQLRWDLETKLLRQVGRAVTDYAHERHRVYRTQALRQQSQGDGQQAIEGFMRYFATGSMDARDRTMVNSWLRTRGVVDLDVLEQVLRSVDGDGVPKGQRGAP
ncbi:MAG TPA: hypothetical protein PKL73_24210 [Polyangiaceae bacterium]|nr:hypothetical protein [Polyangiaceae bacterium]HNZ23869.1 hypothetical protein [Polyangiaceae bacterium]HOD22934.1 hypothetical protein [Polyangiaceae bacterium]HOE51598.1 hypothetical protein [Polyangiaceae bacterium]HOH01717.1 hypothetical protein [Polyangiaceae bacterium]